ncbi:MAG TPA: NAD(P)-dependent oxidoreductase [Cellulomonas sp.]
MTTVLLPSTLPLSLTPPPGVRTATYDVHRPIPAELADSEVLVIWGNPAEQMADAARRMDRLRWVQTLTSGADAVLAAGFGPQVRVTSGRGLHDGPVAEHTLALVLALARGLPDLVRAQQQHRWTGLPGGIEPEPYTATHRTFLTLDGAQVLIWGFGSIAGRLAPLLTALGAQVTGVASRAGERGGYPVVAAEQVDALLPGTDLLIGILPATPATRRVLGPAVFDRLPSHAHLVNVGRGATLDSGALLAAVRDGRIAGAALDVFETEPLPEGSPLWDEPRILVSPHIAGGRPIGADALLSRNLAAFVQDGPLHNLVRG